MLPQLEATAQKLLNDLGQLEWIGQDDPSYTFRWRTRLNFAKYLEHKRHLLEWTELIAGILGREGGDIRIPRGVDSRLAETLNLLDDLPFDAPFPGRRLAAGRGLTLGQLNRMCLRHSALTLHGYWDKRRIDRACTLLNQPASSIKGAASALGFTRLSHFSTWFKRHTGQSPRTYHRAAMATASP
jgi:AraC-like DNA-binding protein